MLLGVAMDVVMLMGDAGANTYTSSMMIAVVIMVFALLGSGLVMA